MIYFLIARESSKIEKIVLYKFKKIYIDRE
jgi:hypothetical protein